MGLNDFFEQRKSKKRLQKIEKAKSAGRSVNISCDVCGRQCQAAKKPIPAHVVMVMTPDIAAVAARHCPECSIIVCPRCASAVPSQPGPVTTGRPCPRCGKETAFASIYDLSQTKTKLV